MSIGYDQLNVKGNTNQYINALSIWVFGNEKIENPENSEVKILYWVETGVLP